MPNFHHVGCGDREDLCLMSPGPSARLSLDFDRTIQCLNLTQSTLLFLKKTIDAES